MTCHSLLERAIAFGRLAIALASVNSYAHDAVLSAFATSKFGSGDLHSWSDAGPGFYGLAAGDRICQQRAALAQLPDPSRYVAWLSDRNNDAYCRVFGLNGKKANNCGQATLPKGAGPWARVDGMPFAAVIEGALDEDLVYAPLNVDEFGHAFTIHAESFTATDETGAFNTQLEDDGDCNKWTSGVQDPFGPFPTLGSNLGSGSSWTYNGTGVSCDGTRRLMCMQKGIGAPIRGHSHFGHREAFISSIELDGDLGGFEGADALCQALATSAHLYRADSFKALLSSFTYNVDIGDRIAVDGEWYRRDGLLFAHNKAELVGGAVSLPLNVTELGGYVDYTVALTGSWYEGTAISDFDCGGWQSTAGIVSGSLANEIAFSPSGGHDWLSPAEMSCAGPSSQIDWPLRLYCLSDADVLYHDEFDMLPSGL